MKKKGRAASDTGHEAITLSEVKQSPKDKGSASAREVDKDRKYRGWLPGAGRARVSTGTVSVLQDGRGSRGRMVA